MPSGPVHDEQGDCSGTGAFSNFNQVLVHAFDVDGRQHQSGVNATGRTDGTEQIGPVEALVAQRARAGAAPGPDAGQRALLANPCFVPRLREDRLWNQISTGLPAALLPSASFAKSGRFF